MVFSLLSVTCTEGVVPKKDESEGFEQVLRLWFLSNESTGTITPESIDLMSVNRRWKTRV